MLLKVAVQYYDVTNNKEKKEKEKKKKIIFGMSVLHFMYQMPSCST